MPEIGDETGVTEQAERAKLVQLDDDRRSLLPVAQVCHDAVVAGGSVLTDAVVAIDAQAHGDEYAKGV